MFKISEIHVSQVFQDPIQNHVSPSSVCLESCSYKIFFSVLYLQLLSISWDEASPAFGSYTQNIGFCDGVKVDIPKGFEDTSKYNGTLAHKAQHSFGEANVYLTTVCWFKLRLLKYRTRAIITRSWLETTLEY